MAEENKQLFARTALLLGQPVMERLAGTRVILFGVGGVGSWCAEALVRSGIGHLTMVDGDVVMPTNLNRQLPALTDTIGQPKVAVLKQRLQRINPDAQIEAVQGRYNADTAESFHLENYDFVIDAIDSVADKALLIRHATFIPTIHLFSSMGAARKLDPTRIRIAEFWKVSGDPLARVLRQRFKHDGLYPARKFLCVYSDEQLANAADVPTDETRANGTVAHITAIFGNMLASMVINTLV